MALKKINTKPPNNPRHVLSGTYVQPLPGFYDQEVVVHISNHVDELLPGMARIKSLAGTHGLAAGDGLPGSVIEPGVVKKEGDEFS